MKKQLELGLHRWLWIAAIASMVTGCGERALQSEEGIYLVSGKVVDSNGAPLSVGVIEFYTESTQGGLAMGSVEAEGKFSLKAAPGEYLVKYHPTDRERRMHIFKGVFRVVPDKNYVELEYPY